jgi:hypothetical protein
MIRREFITPLGRKPRDKAKVEVAVQIVQRFVLARLRNRRFFSLNESQRRNPRDGRRPQRQDAEIDRPALKAFPSTPYQYAEWISR